MRPFECIREIARTLHDSTLQGRAFKSLVGYYDHQSSSDLDYTSEWVDEMGIPYFRYFGKGLFRIALEVIVEGDSQWFEYDSPSDGNHRSYSWRESNLVPVLEVRFGKRDAFPKMTRLPIRRSCDWIRPEYHGDDRPESYGRAWRKVTV